MKETMMITRNIKTMEEDEKAVVALKKKKKKKNTTAYLYFHKFSRFSTMKSLFRFTFAPKLWYNTIHHDYLPRLSDDIIFFHIINRLPSKTLRRFSCVSKLWYNTIHHDPFFIDSHCNHSKSNPSLVLIYATSSETHFNFKYLDDEHQVASSFSYTLVANFKNNWRQVIGSVNGLTCFSTIYFIEVCNLSTHEILGIPYPPKWKILDPCSYGFGFDPLVNQYKVLRVTDSVCQIYTLGAGMNRSNSNTQDCIWRDITVTSHLPLLHECRMKLGAPPYVFASGALFRVISRANIIVLFDIHHEKFQVIPGLLSRDGFRLYTICEFRGCPCAVYCATIVDGYEFSLCTLKKQQSSSNSNVGSAHFVFERSVRFAFKTLINNFTLSFTEYSGHVLLLWYDNTDQMHFYVYNPHTERLQKEVSGSSPSCFNALFVKHTDNLLSLKKFVPLSPPGAPVTEVRYLSSREATMHDDQGSPTTLSLKSTLCCLGSNAKKHQHQDLNQWGHSIYMSRFK